MRPSNAIDSITAMLDAVVIGAGHAGLAASYRLREAGLDHVVLEQGEIGQSWRSQRWDSFSLNTPNGLNHLPGAPADGTDADAFQHRDAWVARLERYARELSLPVRTKTPVTSVSQDLGTFRVGIAEGASLHARNVIVASGCANVPRLPPFASDLDPRITLLTTGGYRRADQLPAGAVLIVGSAQSGCQIAEELRDAGREVYLATGNVGRVPRRVRGRDTLMWFSETGWMDQRRADLADPAMARWAQPQISGVGRRGHTVSLRSLAERGVTLLGHLERAAGTRLELADDLVAHSQFADEVSRRAREHIDAYIERAGLHAPPSDEDPADAPPDPVVLQAPDSLDLLDRGITSIIFTIGFGTDLSWLNVPALDERGGPIHDEGRSPVDGLWFLGWTWMRRRKSGIIWGAAEDSAYVVDQVRRRSSIGRLAKAE